MIEKTYVSDVLPYQHLCGTSGGVTSFPNLSYNPQFCVAPRIFSHELNYIVGLSVVRKQTPTSDFVIWGLGGLNTDYYPSYDGIGWEVDGVTGKFIRHLDFGVNVYAPAWLKLGRSNTMLIGYLLLGSIFILYRTLIDPNGVRPIQSGLVEVDIAKYGTWNKNFMCFDEATDVALIVTFLTPPSHISLHSFTTGALVRHIPVCGTPIDAHWEPGNKAYVVSDRGVVTLIDYVTGRTYSVTKLELPPSTSTHNTTSGWKTGYVPELKRILFLGASANLVNGSSTLRIRGYRNIPSATRLTKPIPLSRPRVGHQTTFAVRAIGEVGEVASSPTITAHIDNGNEVLITPGVSTDSQGYGYILTSGKFAGLDAISVDATATQPAIVEGTESTLYTSKFCYSGYHPLGQIFALQVDKYLYSYTILSDEYDYVTLLTRLANEINFKILGLVTGTVVGSISGEVKGRVGAITVRGFVTNGVFVGNSTGAISGAISCGISNDTSSTGTLTGTVTSGGVCSIATVLGGDTLIVKNVPVNPTVTSGSTFVEQPKIDLIGGFT